MAQPVTCSSYSSDEDVWLIISKTHIKFGLLVVVSGAFICAILQWILRRRRRIELKGKRILITGAAMGIGRETAKLLFQRGCTVVLWDIQEGPMKELVEQLNSTVLNHSPQAFSVSCDVSSKNSVEKAAQQSHECVGHFDVVINNAGVVNGKYLSDASHEELVRTQSVNFVGTCFVTKEFIQSFISRRSGHIINVSSLMGMMWGTRLSDYCASKFAVVGFTHCVRMELRKLTGGSVLCTLVCPFAVNTGMFRGMQTNFQWLFPVLDSQYVASRIVGAIEYQEEMVVIPPILHWIISFLFLLPLCVQDFVLAVCGGMHGMDGFTGHVESK
jgi:all-trans-retinol dehydrogenase (NAD+)